MQHHRTIWRGVAALWSALALGAPVAAAESIDQANWVQRKQQITLPNGQTIHYVVLGDPKAPPVLLLHGYSDTSRSFTPMAPHLSGLRLYLIDQRGHGQSGRPECCYAIADMAHDAKLLLDAMKIGRAHIVGHSLGSMAAQVLAATYPERVQKLVLISSTSGPAISRGGWLWTEVHKTVDPIDPKGDFITAFQSNPTRVDSRFLNLVKAESAAMPSAVWRAVARELVQTQFAPLAPDIAAPVLILWGEKDEMFGAGHQAVLRNALPAAQLKSYAGLGHNLHWERPQDVAQAVGAFLRE